MSQAAETRGGDFISALRLRDFRTLWISSMLSGSGQWTLVVARGWLMEKLTGSAGAVGLTVFAGMVPYLLVTPVGGILADRFDRKRLSAAMQGVSLAATGLLALLVFAGVVQPWHVVVLALVAGAGRAVETPATTSLIPNLVPMSRLLNAISLNSVATFGSRLAGPALALILLDRGSIGGVFVMTASLYALAMLFMLSVRSPRARSRPTEGVWRQTSDAWKYVASTPLLPMIFLLASAHCGLTMITDSVLPGFAKTTLHGDSATYDILIIGFGAGTTVGTFALGGLRNDHTKGSLFLGTAVLSGVTLAVMGLIQTSFPAFVLMAVMGAAQGMFMALGNTLVQETVPDELRGRVSSAYLMAAGGLMSFGNLGAGALADGFSIPVVLIVPGIGFAAMVIGLSCLRPSLRRLYRTGAMPGAATIAGGTAAVAVSV